jgi:hypothetical protein
MDRLASPNNLGLDDLKALWNSILDCVLSQDRISWLAFFDARLDSLHGQTLTLDFRDSQKLSGEHDFKSVRTTRQVELLKSAIFQITGLSLEILEK